MRRRRARSRLQGWTGVVPAALGAQSHGSDAQLALGTGARRSLQGWRRAARRRRADLAMARDRPPARLTKSGAFSLAIGGDHSLRGRHLERRRARDARFRPARPGVDRRAHGHAYAGDDAQRRHQRHAGRGTARLRLAEIDRDGRRSARACDPSTSVWSARAASSPRKSCLRSGTVFASSSMDEVARRGVADALAEARAIATKRDRRLRPVARSRRVRSDRGAGRRHARTRRHPRPRFPRCVGRPGRTTPHAARSSSSNSIRIAINPVETGRAARHARCRNRPRGALAMGRLNSLESRYGAANYRAAAGDARARRGRPMSGTRTAAATST